MASKMKNTKYFALITAMILLISLFAGCGGNNVTPPADTVSPTNTAAPAATATNAPAASNEDDGYEEGVSPEDDIVHTTPADKVLLAVSFGTSFNQSRSLTIGGIEAALRKAYPDYQIRRAFTSQIIIDKLAEREGLIIDNVEDAMNRLVLDKVKEVVILPTTIMNGYEYDDIIDEVMPFASKFESFKVGNNLFAEDRDYDEVAETLVSETSKHRAEGTAIVFMGHGTEHEANVTYTKFQGVLADKGYNDYVIGTVEAEPSLDEVREILAEMNAKKVVLYPLMIVAGDHANNDMAGDEEDSWKTVLTEDGYTVEAVLEGLGQMKGIQDIFIRHAQDTLNSENLALTLAASAAGVTAESIENGVYSIEVDSNSAMFKITDCTLTVDDNTMTASMTMSGVGYDMIYWGTIEQAQADEENAFRPYAEGSQNVYTVPVAALDKKLDCAGHGAKSGKWFDHILVFESDTLETISESLAAASAETPLVSDSQPEPLQDTSEPLPEPEPSNAAEAEFVSGQIDVTLSGGSGRAAISSPTDISLVDGTYYAKIVWSSPNYIYMLADGEKYLTINTEGNSVFEIPVELDTDITVIACTVAMSEPHEIEYTLYFDSSSMQ